jgi:hypothetical protein
MRLKTKRTLSKDSLILFAFFKFVVLFYGSVAVVESVSSFLCSFLDGPSARVLTLLMASDCAFCRAFLYLDI